MLGLFRRKPAAAQGPAPAPSKPERQFLTTRRYPLFYHSITKCGCTYLKNVLYQLDHGRAHPDPMRIHGHQARDLVMSDGGGREALRASPYCFTVLRDPMSRFLSLYYDKAYGASAGNFDFFQDALVRGFGFDARPDIDTDAHRANCAALLTFLQQNMAGKTALPQNPHWRPQAVRLRRIEGLAFHEIPLPLVDTVLPSILSPLIPDIAEVMARVTVRNEAPKPIPAADLDTPDLRDGVEALYARDKERYQRALETWNGV